MIVDCPSCSARFRFATETHAGKRIRLRCARCKAVFPFDVPASGLQVLVAHSDRELCTTVRDLLDDAGISSRFCHRGDEALKLLTHQAPDVLLVDVALPGLYVFEVVERVRSLPGLADIKVILLSSVYNKAAYKRRPETLYGADDYIEKHHIPDDLVPKIRSLAAGQIPGVPRAAGSAEEQQAWDAVNRRLQQAEQEQVCLGQEEDMAQARKLARIVASDIALYHQDKVEMGIRHGNLFELMAEELREGERLFDERLGKGANLGRRLLREAFEDLIASRVVAARH